jgi:hypothetical protein
MGIAKEPEERKTIYPLLVSAIAKHHHLKPADVLRMLGAGVESCLGIGEDIG